jgi:plasmid stabilization system protein ParE
MGLTAPARRLPRAAQSGDKARQSFAKRVEMAGQGTARPEVMQARAFLSANP